MHDVPPNTFARALAGSAAAPEKLSVLFGGASQNLDFKVGVFQVSLSRGDPPRPRYPGIDGYAGRHDDFDHPPSGSTAPRMDRPSGRTWC